MTEGKIVPVLEQGRDVLKAVGGDQRSGPADQAHTQDGERDCRDGSKDDLGEVFAVLMRRIVNQKKRGQAGERSECREQAGSGKRAEGSRENNAGCKGGGDHAPGATGQVERRGVGGARSASASSGAACANQNR